MMTLDALQHQAGRLRFADAELERRFRDERQAQGRNRARGMLVLGTFVVCALGLVDVTVNAATTPAFASVSLQIRFLVVAPIWLGMLVSTALPGHRGRADPVYAAGTTVVAWALGSLPWFWSEFIPGRPVAQPVLVNVLSVLLLSAATLPMRFPAVAATTALSVGGVAGLFLATRQSTRADDARIVATALGGIGGLVVVLSWLREAAERRMFAQREQVRDLNVELARLNAEKNEFMAIAAHDLRAPLASMRGLAEQLQAGRPADAEGRARAHAAIRELSERMLSFVNDYLGVHAAESGSLPVRLERVDLRSAADEAGRRHAAAAAAKQQRVEVGPGAAWVRADPGLLAQVADNFVTNALKFSPQGATVSLAATVAADGGAARLEVTDAGPGVALDEQANLFRKFGRTRVQPTGGEASHGLGLAVAKRLAETMGGSVGCDSPVTADGTGARFWIQLPGE